MVFTKKKKLQIVFFSLIFIGSIFNGSNSNNLIIFNFLSFLFLLLYLLKDKNNYSLLKIIILNNKIIFISLILLFIYLFLQTVSLPFEWLSFFSKNYYLYLNSIELLNDNSISLNPRQSLIKIANYITILIISLITLILFIKKNHFKRFLYYLTFIGFIHAVVGIYLFLIGNPDFFLKDNIYYKNSSTGFFINRTNYSLFLVMTFISGIHLIFKKNNFFLINKNQYPHFEIIYIRIFLLFISIAIITSFSRLGNFYLISSMLFYFFYSITKSKKIFNNLTIIFILFILFDFLIMGFYFGGSKLLDRFYFINEDLKIDYFNSNIINNTNDLSNTNNNISRLEIIFLGLQYFKNFYLFGYGLGSFETVFTIFYDNLDNFYADHAHSDLIELLGEIGLVGFIFLLPLVVFLVKKIILIFKGHQVDKKVIILSLLIILIIDLFFDFSLNIPSNQFVYFSLLTLVLKKHY